MVIQITDATLDKVLKTDKPVVIDFWAMVWPMQNGHSIIEQLAEEYKDNVIIGKIDVDENNEATTKYGIRNIPTILFIKKGQVMDKIITIDKRLLSIKSISYFKPNKMEYRSNDFIGQNYERKIEPELTPSDGCTWKRIWVNWMKIRLNWLNRQKLKIMETIKQLKQQEHNQSERNNKSYKRLPESEHHILNMPE